MKVAAINSACKIYWDPHHYFDFMHGQGQCLSLSFLYPSLLSTAHLQGLEGHSFSLLVISNEDFHYENLYLHYTSHCNFYHERHVLYLQHNFVWIWIPEMKTTCAVINLESSILRKKNFLT